MEILDHDIIVAPATASGGALAVVRLSGDGAPACCDRIFRGRKPLAGADGYTVHFGRMMDGERVVDEVLVSVFRAPHSYTGEDSVEISCHGSSYIVSEILRLLIAAGARMATPGEFTIRAYLAGKMDLAQAEAVSDLIASSSRAAHRIAVEQLRGGYSSSLDGLREELVRLASLVELELDFSEEDVEFADRHELRSTMERIAERIDTLRNSFALGNALKQGVAVAIVGAPNVGKSTLLNRLVCDDRAMVSEIAGTTRDVIEERTNINGVEFRFLDTAGIRATDDRLEQMGIERTHRSISQARIVIRMTDAAALATSDDSTAELPTPDFEVRDDQRIITVANKIDLAPDAVLPQGVIAISARDGVGVDALRKQLRDAVDTEALYHGDTIISTSRHHEALVKASESLSEAVAALDNDLPTDLLSEELRRVIHHIGLITCRGMITPDELLESIFSKFCIGK